MDYNPVGPPESYEWYYIKNDQVHGPVTFEELKRQATQPITEDVIKVWCNGLQNNNGWWVPATYISGLHNWIHEAPRCHRDPNAPPPIPPKRQEGLDGSGCLAIILFVGLACCVIFIMAPVVPIILPIFIVCVIFFVICSLLGIKF
jgi:hypothetical protein